MYLATQDAAKLYGLAGCACGCDKALGLGSFDLSTWTWEDWLLVGIGGMALYAMVNPGSSLFNWKPSRSHKQGFIGGLITPLILLGGGYLAYQYYVANQSGS